MRILVVDDDPLAAAMVAAILEGAGHEVIMAADGMEAMQIFSTEEQIALVISDMNMPLISGLDLLHELRAQMPTLPFILLTGDDPTPLLATEPGLDGCLLKDFDLEESLPQLILTVLSRSTSNMNTEKSR